METAAVCSPSPKPTRPDAAPALALTARSSYHSHLRSNPPFCRSRRGKEGREVPLDRWRRSPTLPVHWVSDGGLDNRPIGVCSSIFDRQPDGRFAGCSCRLPSSDLHPTRCMSHHRTTSTKPSGSSTGCWPGRGHHPVDRGRPTRVRAIRTAWKRAQMPNCGSQSWRNAAERHGCSPRPCSRITRTREAKASRPRPSPTLCCAGFPACPRPESGPGNRSLPKSWSAELTVGEVTPAKVCRQQITATIHFLGAADRPAAPESSELARFPVNLTLQECALRHRAAFQLARSDADIAALAEVTRKIHRAWRPTVIRSQCVRCGRCVADQRSDRGSLENAADQLAAIYLQSGAGDGRAARCRLGEHYPTLKRNAASASADSGAPIDSLLARDHVAAGQFETLPQHLGTYPGRADDSRDAPTMAWKLFDLRHDAARVLPAICRDRAGLELDTELAQPAADWQTAQQKLTGMRLHLSIAFYRIMASQYDWMWGRLDRQDGSSTCC